MTEMTTEALVAGVRKWATDAYDEGGWDVIVECWTDEMIVDQIAGAKTVIGAVRKMHGPVSVYADRQADAKNSVF